MSAYAALEHARWGSPCVKCGHPADYHGMTFCRCEAGSSSKKMCDCDGYNGGGSE